MICRDPEFWRGVAAHPMVSPHMGKGYDIGALAVHPMVLPLRVGRGGFLFHRLDALGTVWDLHALFEPSDWGRAVSQGLKDALCQFGWQVVTVQEVCGWWRSRPPKSFGFRPAGEFKATPLGVFRTWVLTRAAWEQSPARKRLR